MKINTKVIRDFIQTWKDQGSEIADKVTYWNTLLEILGVPKEQIENKTFIEYEKPIKLKENEKFHGSIDAYIPSTKVLIEQKSNGVDLFAPESRPNGGNKEKITPFEQAKRYDNYLGSREKADFLVLSNFKKIVVYDVRDSLDATPVSIDLKDLKKDLYLLNFLVKPDETTRLEKEKNVSVDAGELVRKIYNELANIFTKYDQVDAEKIKHSINTLCVRLVFCLYAEDAGLFPAKEQFYNYLEPIVPNQMGLALKSLFKVLDTKIDDRKKGDPFWEDEHPELSQFPYVNGGLFKEEDIIIPPFTPELKDIVLNQASRGFNWSNISPTIFGAVFESTLNPETRRQGGMHYTSVENIHKVIDPLFLNDLQAELDSIKKYKNQKTIEEKARAFQEKLANLTFFDPACGSGNFLTETFLSLRKLENEAIRLETHNESLLTYNNVEADKNRIRVSIQQFYGIEVNDFAVSVAKTALWIAENQMMQETQDLLYALDWDFLPLKTYTKIHKGNALRMDWNSVLPNYACDFIIGNPPFIGSRVMDSSQKDDMKLFFKKVGRLDYVCAWYMKAMQYINNSENKGTHCAFVSTNSITQGIEVPELWPTLLKNGLKIDFAYQTFIWDNQVKDKAHVHCVIIGFSFSKHSKKAKLFDQNGNLQLVDNINPYLLSGDNVIVHSSRKPLNPLAKKMLSGDKPRDNKGLLIDLDTYKYLEENDATAFKYVRPYMMGKELIHNISRYCLWLENASPTDIRKDKFIQDRLKIVRDYRLSSPAKSIQKLADTPSLFADRVKINADYIGIPVVSSKTRKYIPMGFINKKVVPGNKLFVIPNGTFYDFGVLESNVHMAWMRTIAQRMKSDYSYSNVIVYNTFPWPDIDDKHREKIADTAQTILDARSNYSDASLADLYDDFSMPPDLRKAHQANDKAVLQAYGLPVDTTESKIVAHLFKMYEQLIQNN